MVILTEIANELVAQIFDFLESVQDVKQCQLTCKDWSTIAQERIYKTVTLTDEKHAKSFFHTISHSSRFPGQYTREISMPGRYFPESSTHWDPHGYFNLITTYLPNVQVLNIFLQPSMIKKLIEEREKGNFQHVRQFWVTKSTPDTTRLFLTYRDTLQVLYLSDGATENSPKPQSAQVNEYKKIMTKLDELKDLKGLTLEIFTNKNLYKLETYTTKFPQLENITYTPFRNNIVDEEDVDLASALIPTPSLKKLNASNIPLTEQAGTYLMYKFPNLRHLVLNKNNVSTYQQPCTMSPETMTRFIQFVVANNNMSFFDIQFSNPKQIPINKVIKTFVEANIKKDTFLMIVYSNSQSQDSYPHIRISKPSAYPSLKWPGVTNDTTSIIEVHFDRWRTVHDDGNSVTLPHLALLDSLKGLKHLTIESGSKYDDLNEQVDLFLREMRGTTVKMIQKCTDLNTQSLQLCESDFWGEYPTNNKLKNDSITRLELEFSHIHHGGFDLFNQSLTSLRYLTLNESEYFDNEKGIDMSNQVLENLTWTKPYRDLNGKIVLHIMDAISDEYKTMDQDGIKACSKRSFDNAMNGYDNVCIRIQCEYLRTITVTYMNFNKTCVVH